LRMDEFFELLHVHNRTMRPGQDAVKPLPITNDNFSIEQSENLKSCFATRTHPKNCNAPPH
jgi:hypothetical protein